MVQESGSRSRVVGYLRRSVLVCVGCVVSAVGCGQALPTVPGPQPSPTAVPTPGPTGSPQYTATPVPFNLLQSQTFDVFGWDSWPRAPTSSAIQFRWDAAVSKYEVLAPGYPGWNRLEAMPSKFGTPSDYDVFGSDGTKRPFHMPVVAPPHFFPRDGYVGNGRIFEGSGAVAYFAFGMATVPGDVPANGTMTCGFAEDEIGEGGLTFDLTAGRVTGWAEPFWASVRYELVQTSFAAGATTFASTFGTGGVLEGRFFGPGAMNVAVRAKGGGPGFSAVTGIMTGSCQR